MSAIACRTSSIADSRREATASGGRPKGRVSIRPASRPCARPGDVPGPFGVEHGGIVDADQVTGTALVVTGAVQGDIGVDHGDALGLRGQRRPAMHHHVAVQGDGVTGAGEIRGDDPVRGRRLPLGGERRGFPLRAQEILEPAARKSRRVGDHHHVVEGDGVVVPLVHGLVHVRRFVIQMPEMHRHGMRRDLDAVDAGHGLRHRRAEAQVPKPAGA